MRIIELIRKYITRKKLQKIMPPVKTADIMKFAFETRPMIAKESYDAVGKFFEVDMKSGKFALYKCVEYEPAFNADWGWYYLEFWECVEEEHI